MAGQYGMQPLVRQGPDLAVAALPMLGTVTAGVQGGLALLSLFREDVEYRGASVMLDPLAIELSLAGNLRNSGAGEVLVPDLTVLPEPSAGTTTLRGRLEEARRARIAAWQSIAPLVRRLTEREAALEAAVSKKDQQEVDETSAEVREIRGALDLITEPMSGIDRRFRELESQLDAASPHDAGMTVLARLLRAEAIMEKQPVFVHIRAVASGGSTRTARSRWSNLFAGDGVSSMGGVVIGWALLSSTGAVEDGGIVARSQVAKHPAPRSSQ